MRRTELKRTRMKRRYRDTGPSDTVRELVHARDKGCVACGSGDDLQVQHRRPRQMGGSRRPDTNEPQNLLLACQTDHAWMESRREEAIDLGWLVPQWQDPAEVPVHHYRYGVVYLAADGSVSQAPHVDGGVAS